MRKKVLRVDSEEPPEYCCNECWYFESKDIEHGACYGHPPQVLVDEDGDPSWMRAFVRPEDRGCAVWKARHKVN